MDRHTDPLAVDVRGLTKSYGEHTVLAGIDLRIAYGETYALLGPNGAGKSTTIETLEGLRRPTSGQVSVVGADPLTASRAWRANIGIVSQSTGDFGPYSPRELLTRFAGFYAEPRSVDGTLELVGLTAHAKKRAAKLSGGQQRRLDVALGIIGRPAMLFLDEPTTGFDPAARRQFWDMLRGLSADGTAILLTTHYLDEAAQLADRVGVLSGGRITAEAPPTELGGPEARMPVVSWRDATGELQEHRTEQPGAFVSSLRDTLGEPNELEIRRPSLEDIYLDLLAREREEAAAS